MPSRQAMEIAAAHVATAASVRELAEEIDAALILERGRCARVADQVRAGLTNGGAINACKLIAGRILEMTDAA